MPTFIDESGDTSFHPDAQPYYRLAAVWVPAHAADGLREALGTVRTSFSLPANYEFKYHKTHYRPELRTAFYRAALASGLKFSVSCIDKQLGWQGAPREHLFYLTTTDLASSLRPVLLEEEARSGKLLREPIRAC